MKPRIEPKQLAIVGVLALYATILLAFMSAYSTPAYPNPPPCQQGGTVTNWTVCSRELATYSAQLKAADTEAGTSQNIMITAVGSGGIASVLLLEGFRGEKPRVPALLVTLAFASLYVFTIVLSVGSFGSLGYFTRQTIVNIFPSVNQSADWSLGEWSAVFFSAATVGFAVLFRSFVKALRFFAIPGLLMNLLAVLLYDYGEMSLHVTSFASWKAGGFYLFSNWTVLGVTLAVGAVLYLPPLAKWTRRCILHPRLQGDASL